MGEMADELAYQESGLMMRDWKVFTWTTRDGKKLKLPEMETSHIKNCIRMLEKQIIDVEYEFQQFSGGYTASVMHDRNEKLEQSIKRFKNELARREGSQDD